LAKTSADKPHIITNVICLSELKNNFAADSPQCHKFSGRVPHIIKMAKSNWGGPGLYAKAKQREASKLPPVVVHMIKDLWPCVQGVLRRTTRKIPPLMMTYPLIH
jgi:hypothetical protein